MSLTDNKGCSGQSTKKVCLTIIAGFLAMLGPFTIDTYLPSFPSIETEFAADRSLLSQSIAVYLLAFGCSTLLWGPVADRFGRRIVILLSLALYIAASIGCAMSQDIETFILMRMFQGLAASGGFTAGRAMIRDVHSASDAQRAMSHVMLLFAIAPAVAPMLGGWLHEHFGWRSIFWFLTFFSMLLIFFASLLNETLAPAERQQLHPRAVSKVYLRTLQHKQFIKLILSLSFSFSGLFLFIAGAPSVIYNFLQLGNHDFSLQFVPMVLGMMLGAYISGRLAQHWPANKTISTGFTIMLLAVLINIILVYFSTATLINVIAPLVIYTLGFAITMPAFTVLILDCFPHHRGTASSMQGFVQMLFNAAVASFAVPLLHNHWSHFVIGQLLFLTLGLVYWLRIKQDIAI